VPDSTVFAPASLQLEMQISFPLQDMPASGQIGTIYSYDEVAEVWRLVLPDSVDDSTMVLKTNRYDALWSWGRVIHSGTKGGKI